MSINRQVWLVVAAIPEGRVATYGGVAERAGIARAARRVGRALRDLPSDTRIPWHRVVAAGGRIAFPAGSPHYLIQRERLESEGIEFRRNGTVDLRKFGW